MKIAVKNIPARPLEATGTLDQNDFRLEKDEIYCISPVEVFARLTKTTNFVDAKARVKTHFTLTCSRCLESFEKEFHKEFTFDYALEPGMTHIELGEDIRQEILMSFPMKILCRHDCRGLCLGCGMNLNNRDACRCIEKDKGSSL